MLHSLSLGGCQDTTFEKTALVVHGSWIHVPGVSQLFAYVRGVKLGKIQPRFYVPAEAKVSFIRKISKNPQNFKDLPHFGQFPAEAREAKQAVLYAPVNSTSNDSSQRVPRCFIEPIEKVVETVIGHVFRCTVVEPRIELVDDGLESDDGEKPRTEC